MEDMMSSVPLMALHSSSKRADGSTRESDQLSDDDDDDPLESVLARMKNRPKSYHAREFWSGLIFSLVIGFVAGFVFSYVVFVSIDNKNRVIVKTSEHADTWTALSAVVEKVTSKSIGSYLEKLRLLGDKSGDEVWNHRQAELIRQHFKDQGFDIVAPIQNSGVMLTYASPDKPNTVLIVGENNKVYNCTTLVKSFPPGQKVNVVSKVIEKDVVYINFGRDIDYDVLKQNSIHVEDKIVLTRLGTVSPLELIYEALKRGAAGVVLYADPQQYPDAGDSASLWPLLTPAQLALLHVLNSENIHEDVHSEDISTAGSVAVQVISADFANQIFQEMKTDENDQAVPEDWRGGLPVEYRFWSSQSSVNLRLEVNTVNVERKFYNVIAGIKGSVEPDRYVMVSTSRDSVEGGDHAKYVGGSAAMMELASVFNMLNTTRGWQPRRSVLFFNWGVVLTQAHYTLPPISDEWLSVLDNVEVAYVSANIPVSGNETLRVHSSPLLYRLVREASALVPNPSLSQVAAGKMTVADSWPEMANLTLPNSNDFMHTMIHNEGIPGIDLSYTDLKPKAGNFSDSELRYHKAVTQLLGVLLVRLTEGPVVPFSPLDYVDFLNHSLAATEMRFTATIQSHLLQLDKLRAAVTDLRTAAISFQKKMESADSLDPLQLRILNDQLLHFEAMFVNSEWNEERSTQSVNRHMVLEPATGLAEPVAGFGRLQEMLSELSWVHDTASLEEHISLLTASVQRARHRLAGPLVLPSSQR